MQRVTKYTGQAFSGVETFLQENFLPNILFGKLRTLPPVVVTLGKFLVNKAGLGPQNPEKSAAERYKIPLHVSYELIGAVTGERDFSTANHLQADKEERREGKKDRDDRNGTKLRGIVNDQGKLRETSLNTRQSHGFLDERAGYYGNWYSTRRNGILRFLMSTL